ncbi:mechanosensitive ion channel family protein [Salmonirosea aquatica]|uniref:Mechanosensitive ion channel n=1 Tax=Salmonirosea aquatica TaxID=2654236 RepID=A0A7C9FXG8_9BACT|nr:mechanosensitive ion channel [Cytophagaceae bacterium SJW1-29]
MDKFTNDLWKVLNGYYYSFLKALPRLALALVLFLVFMFLARQIRRWLIPRLTRNTDDTLLTGFLGDIGYWLMLILGLSVALGTIGLNGAVTNILAGAGLSAFILGFALKDIGENFLAGILLAFKRPFKIGDLVETQGVHGRIIDLSLRETIIKTLDGKDVYVPNGGILKSPLYNYSVDNFLRLEFSVDLDNRENYKRAIPLIKKALLDTTGVLHDTDRVPTVSIEETKSNALCMKICFWIKSHETETQAPAIKTEAIQNVLTMLRENGFSQPETESETKG